jgi:hypothetical protein
MDGPGGIVPGSIEVAGIMPMPPGATGMVPGSIVPGMGLPPKGIVGGKALKEPGGDPCIMPAVGGIIVPGMPGGGMPGTGLYEPAGYIVCGGPCG